MKNKRQLVLFAGAVFLLWFSQYVFVPTLPEFLRSKVHSLALVGSILAMYGLWQAAVRLPLGILIDAIGRQKLFLLGGFLIGALGAAISRQRRDDSALLCRPIINRIVDEYMGAPGRGLQRLLPARTIRTGERNPDPGYRGSQNRRNHIERLSQ